MPKGEGHHKQCTIKTNLRSQDLIIKKKCHENCGKFNKIPVLTHEVFLLVNIDLF